MCRKNNKAKELIEQMIAEFDKAEQEMKDPIMYVCFEDGWYSFAERSDGYKKITLKHFFSTEGITEHSLYSQLGQYGYKHKDLVA